MNLSISPVTQIVIKPKKGWQLIDWKEIIEYKDLFYFLVLRDIKALYKQTVLGSTFAIIYFMDFYHITGNQFINCK